MDARKRAERKRSGRKGNRARSVDQCSKEVENKRKEGTARKNTMKVKERNNCKQNRAVKRENK